MTPTGAWALVVPVKGGPLAKSRLALPHAHRVALADAFARDTVAAARLAEPGAPVVVVTGDARVAAWARAEGCRTVPDAGAGLDAAVAAGVAQAASLGATRAAVLLADHPALRASELAEALARASRHERALVVDADGSGTALLTLPAGPGARTAFGPGSAAAHRGLGHVGLDGRMPGLRLDVDDAGSLRAALALGVGAHTTAAVARATLPDVQATIHHVAEDGSGTALLDDGLEVTLPPDAALAAGLLHLRPGQRVSVELDESGRSATRVWIVGIGPGETIR